MDKTKNIPESFIVNSDCMREVIQQVKRVAKVSTTILLVGESGVGKEMVAKSIHELGERSDKPFLKLNCGAIPDNLIESELFGYVGGAFSGANPSGKKGYFTQANRGILFLDEIGELDLNLQVKLLRALQEKEITPIGGVDPLKIDVQIIAATNKDLEKMVQEGTFREDLYYRLHIIPIHIPPLRERVDDIPFLCDFFINKYNECYNRQICLTFDAIEILKKYPWYGNVRELQNVIERITVISEVDHINSEIIKKYLPKEKTLNKNIPLITDIMPLQEAFDYVEQQLIIKAMEKYNSITLSAKALGISQPTMSRKLQAIKEKMNKKEFDSSRMLLEEEINNHLRSVALVTATLLNYDDIKFLINKMNTQNPAYQKLQKGLTTIRKREGKIQWAYIIRVTEENKVEFLVTDAEVSIKPGYQYEGPEEIMSCIFKVWKGEIGVTDIYTDEFGEYKSSLAPIKDEKGNVIAIVGVDFNSNYVNEQVSKYKKILNVR